MIGRAGCGLTTILAVWMAAGSAGAADWTLAAGPGYAPDYEGSEDYELVPAFALRGDNLYHPSTFVQIVGTRLESNLYPSDSLRLGPSAEYVAARNDVDDDQVDLLPKTDDALFLGGEIGYDFDPSPARVLAVEFEGRGDPGGDLGGLFSLRGVYNAPLGSQGKWYFQGRVEGTYATTDYMSNFFSVSAADSVASGLSTFDADAGIKDVRTRLQFTYNINDQWSITGAGIYMRLLGDAEDSPITKDENQFTAAALVGFSF